MVSQFYAPVVGGEERAVEDLSMALVRRGHSVAVATLAHPGSPAFEVRGGVRVHRIQGTAQRVGALFSEAERQHAPPAPDPEAMLALGRVLRSERSDVAHAHNWLVHSLVPLKRSLRIPMVLSLHDHSLICSTKRLMRGAHPCEGPGVAKCLACASDYYGIAKGPPIAASLLLSAAALRSTVDFFLPVSEAVAKKSRLPTGAAPYEVLPNFVPDRLFEASEPTEEETEGLPDPGFLSFAGDLTDDKGVQVLLEAYAGLREAPPLVLIGRPYAYGSRELPANVLLLGVRSHATVLDAWRRCSIAVVPSVLCESFGIAALEAMAMGRPVVAARSGGLAEIVVDGETGVLTPPGAPLPLRAALERLLRDAGLRERMGAAARRHAMSSFSEGTVVSRLEDVYRSVLGRRDAAAGPGWSSRTRVALRLGRRSRALG